MSYPTPERSGSSLAIPVSSRSSPQKIQDCKVSAGMNSSMPIQIVIPKACPSPKKNLSTTAPDLGERTAACFSVPWSPPVMPGFLFTKPKNELHKHSRKILENLDWVADGRTKRHSEVLEC